MARQTQPTAAANGSHSPEHSEDGCSWCDKGRLAPGTRPPTSDKSVTETLTPPTHGHPCPCLPLAAARSPITHSVSWQRPPRLLGARERTCFLNKTEHRFILRLGRGLRRRGAAAGRLVKEVSPPHPPPPPSSVAPRPRCSRDA